MFKTCLHVALTMLFLGVAISAARAEDPSETDQPSAGTQDSGSTAPPAYLFDALKPDRESPAAGAGLPAAEDGGAESATPPEYLFDVLEPARERSAAEAGGKRTHRGFFDIFLGTMKTKDSWVSATSQDCSLFFCSPLEDYSQQADFSDSSAFGVRFGRWLEDNPAVGLALDISTLHTDAPGIQDPYNPGAMTSGVDIWCMPISFALLIRTQFLRTDTVPDGRLQPYVGFMLSLVIGDIDVNGIGGSSVELGGGANLGIAWHFQRLGLFAEYRILNASLDYDSEDDDWSWFGSKTASADLATSQILFGISIKY